MKGKNEIWNGPCPVCGNMKYHRDNCYVEKFTIYILERSINNDCVKALPKLPSFDKAKEETLKNDFFKDYSVTSDEEFVMLHFYNTLKKLGNFT